MLLTEDYKQGYEAGWRAREESVKVASPTKTYSADADKIVGVVCGYFQTDLQVLERTSRKREIVYARQLCMYFLKKHTRLSLKVIGEMFGGKDHTSVIHSVEKIKDLMEAHEDVRNDVMTISGSITENRLISPYTIPGLKMDPAY